MRGRKPLPTHIKLVTANHHTDRFNKSEAKLKPRIPEPPPELNADARLEWNQISLKLHAAGLLTVIDKAVLAAYCQAYGRWVTAERVLARMADRDPVTKGLLIKTKNGNVMQSPLTGIANKAMSDMVRYAMEFGMSPSSRSRVRAEPRADADDAERFFD